MIVFGLLYYVYQCQWVFIIVMEQDSRFVVLYMLIVYVLDLVMKVYFCICGVIVVGLKEVGYGFLKFYDDVIKKGLGVFWLFVVDLLVMLQILEFVND